MGLLPGLANNAAAQQTDGSNAEKYRIKLVQNENGKEKVIDRTFSSRREMAEFIKANNLDIPVAPVAPPVPPLPPLAPPPPHVDVKGKNCINQCRHLVITDGEDSTNSGELKIITDNLPGEDVAEIEKELSDTEAGEVKVIIIKKGGDGDDKKQVKTIIINDESGKVKKSALNNEAEEKPNIYGLKLFPNPAGAAFSIAFSVDKPCTIKLRISDLNGKVLYSESLENFSGKFEKKISRLEFPAGTYTVDVESPNEKESRRLVVQ